MSSQAASSSSDYSTSKTNSMVRFLNKVKFVSCVLAMSKINLNALNKNFAHAALLLIDTESYHDDDSRGSGLVVEYGDYNPTMSKEEKEAVEKGEVIYRYNEKGGLRYYAIDYKEYIKIFGDICYVSMDIESNNQMAFQYFLDKIAPTSENIWIQEKYKINYMTGIIEDGNDNHNCQSFASEALTMLRPLFIPNNIKVTDSFWETEKKIEIFPIFIQEVLDTLNKLF